MNTDVEDDMTYLETRCGEVPVIPIRNEYGFDCSLFFLWTNAAKEYLEKNTSNNKLFEMFLRSARAYGKERDVGEFEDEEGDGLDVLLDCYSNELIAIANEGTNEDISLLFNAIKTCVWSKEDIVVTIAFNIKPRVPIRAEYNMHIGKTGMSRLEFKFCNKKIVAE
jgi:hypothetical protein